MRVSIERHVRAVGQLSSEEAKRAYLQALIGAPSTNAVTLTFRAELVTALKAAHAWPHMIVRETGCE